MDLLHKVFLGFISGFSDLIFTSASAHQSLYRTITGYELADSFLPLAIHAGSLIALLVNCGKRVERLRYEKRLQHSTRRRRVNSVDIAALMDIRILNTAVVPLLVGFLFYRSISQLITGPIWIALLLVINGGILFLPRLLGSGNKDGRSFTQLDGFLIGLSGVLGMLPGFSRVGCMYSTGVACGAKKNYALELSLLLSIPSIAAMLSLDIYGCVVASGSVSGLQLLGALMAALAAFCGAHFAIVLIRFICNRATTVGFAYYSCGLAMFMFLIYLLVP